MTGWAWLTITAVVLLVGAVLAARRRRCAVYEFYDASGRAVYVGMTCNIASRFRQHRRSSWWWPQVDPSRTRVKWYPSRDRAAAVERATIRRLHTVGNVVHNGRHAPSRRHVTSL